MTTQHNTTQHKRFAFLMIFWLLSVHFVYSQFTIVDRNSLLLSATEQNEESKILSLPRSGDPLFISTSAFNSWGGSSTGAFNLTFPGISGTFDISPLKINYNSENSYEYYGKIGGSSLNTIFAITKDELGVSGIAFFGDDRYYIYPFSPTYSIVIKDGIVKTDTGADCSSDAAPDEDPDFVDYCEPSNNDCPALVDVLLLVHSGLPEVPPGFANISRLVMQAIFLNSDIPNKEVRFRLMRVPPSITFNLTNNPEADANALSNNAQINDLRSSTGSDIVVLLTNQTWTLGNSTIFGSVTTDGIKVKKNSAYSVVFYPQAIGPRFTLIHEIAHLMGARHARGFFPGADNTADCAHGHFFNGISGAYRPTVLGPLGTGSRIPFFSNPDISYDGFATGVSGPQNTTSADNARKIRKSMCAIDDYVDNNFYYAQIYGPDELCPDDNLMYQAYQNNGTNQGQSPFSYEWSIANNASGPYTVLSSTGSIAWVNHASGNPGYVLYLRLRVRLNTNPITYYTTTKVIDIRSACLGSGGTEERTDNLTMNNSHQDIILSPNPATNHIQLNSHENPILNLCILDAAGRITKTVDFGTLGVENTELPLDMLNSGLYLLKCQTINGPVVKKFIIQK